MSQTGPHLTLTVTEQPTKLHRFRYLKELREGRMGSVLHGRSSQKTPVRVEVTAVDRSDHRMDWPMKLVGCTVFEDLAPHPFYLFGDGCSGGVFEKEFVISAGNSKCDVSLERAGIVTTPRAEKPNSRHGSGETRQDDGNYQDRISRWNFFNKPARRNPTKGKDVNNLRLAFQVFVQLPDSKRWTAANCQPVSTEVIRNSKVHSELTVDCVIPKTTSRPDQDIWLYMKDPLPAESASRFKVIVAIKDDEPPIDVPVKSLKKHLVVFDFTTVRLRDTVGSVAVRVSDVETGDESEPVNLMLKFEASEEEPASKRARPIMTSRYDLDDLHVLLNGVAEQFFG